MSIRCKRTERGVRVNGKLKLSCAPCCSTRSSSTTRGARGMGGSGSPIFPQPEKLKIKRQMAKGKRQKGREIFAICLALQNVPTEIFILHNIREHILNISRVYDLVFLFQIGSFE